MTHTNVYNMKVEVKLLQEMKGTDWEGGKREHRFDERLCSTLTHIIEILYTCTYI